MNKEQRAAYLGLTEVEFGDFRFNNPIMCTFCCYSEWPECGSDAEPDCKHPLWAVNEPCRDGILEDTGIAVDCWGFRPAFSIEVAADIVGIWLQGKEPDWDTVPTLKKEHYEVPK